MFSSLNRVSCHKIPTISRQLRYLTTESLLNADKRTATRARAFEASVEVSDSLTDEHIFTTEHVTLRRSLRKLIEKEINPYVEQWEEEGKFPAHHVFKTLGNAGFLGVNKPVEYGGLGLDFTYTIAMHEELNQIRCGGVPMAVGVHSDMCTPALTNFGSNELKDQFLKPSIAGDLVGCIGVSETNAGSDVANIVTTARKKGDDYVINGGKMWTTNAGQADWMCVLANTSEGPSPHLNKSLIIVPLDTKGVSRLAPLKKLGMKCSDTVQTFFEDVVVPQKYRIGEEGKGFIYQMKQFQDERLVGSIATVAVLDTLLQETSNFCYNRKAFGKPLLDNQVIHFRLAEIRTENELLRSLIYRAVGQYAAGKDVTYLASMAKLKAGRLGREGTDALLQYWGGTGYLDNYISRAFRDLRLLSIGGGADEVMLGIIAKYMDTLPST